MKLISNIILLLIIIGTLGCEIKKEDESNLRENQISEQNNQQQNVQPKIEVMANFPPEEEIIKNEILIVLNENLEATQNEDVSGVIKTIHEDSPQLASTKGGMEYVFKNFEMRYELEDVKFISITNEEVKAIYQQTTKAVSGTGFTNTRSIG